MSRNTPIPHSSLLTLALLACPVALTAQDETKPEPAISTYKLTNGSTVRGAILETDGKRVQMKVSLSGAGSATSWYDVASFEPKSQVKLKSNLVKEGDVEGQLKVAEFAAEQGLFRQAKIELTRSVKMADAFPEGTHRHLQKRTLDVVVKILGDMCTHGRVSEARAGVSRVLTKYGSIIPEAEQARLHDTVEAGAAKQKMAKEMKRRAKQDAKVKAELDKKIEKAVKLRDKGNAARRKGLLGSKQFALAKRELDRSAKYYEKAIATALEIRKAHVNDAALVAEIDAAISDTRELWTDAVLAGASIRLTRGQFTGATEQVNRILVDDPKNAQALAMRSRIEVAANDWGIW